MGPFSSEAQVSCLRRATIPLGFTSGQEVVPGSRGQVTLKLLPAPKPEWQEVLLMERHDYSCHLDLKQEQVGGATGGLRRMAAANGTCKNNV